MFVGLTIMFGSIILVDTIKENSPKVKRQMKEMDAKTEQYFKESMERVQRKVDERIKLWQDSGLPPSMWK